MGLETATYINDLVSTNPLSSDQKKQGDDHLRLIKSALKASLNGFTGPVVLTGADTGSVNNYALTPSPALAAYVNKMMVLFSPAATNTTTSTLNISGLGAKTIKTVSGAVLTSGDFASGSLYLLAYDGTDFLIINGPTKNYVDQLSFSSSLPAQAGNAGKYLRTDGTVAAWNDVLASPAFTGVPTAPTAAVDTNTTQLATTAFVIGQGYAKLASPTFTGVPACPTPAADITTTQIINAAWFGGQSGTASPIEDGTAAAGSSQRFSKQDHVHPATLQFKNVNITNLTTTQTLAASDTGKVFVVAGASLTITLPTLASAGVGKTFTFIADFDFTLSGNGSENIRYETDAVTKSIREQERVTVMAGSSVWVVTHRTLRPATQSDMETATANQYAVTPLSQKWHPSAAKSWCDATAAGAINASYNMTSVTDNGTGDLTFNIAIDHSSANYAAVATCGSGTRAFAIVTAKTAGTVQILSKLDDNTASDTVVLMATFGDQ